jgi:hypothetical protein
MRLQTTAASKIGLKAAPRKCWAEPLDLPPEPNSLARLYSHWQVLCCGSAMPERHAVRPEELHFALGYINLVEIRREPEQFAFRVAGTKVFARRPNADSINTVDDITPRVYAALVKDHFREARDRAAPTLYRIFVSNGRDTRSYQRLLLPLAWQDRCPGMLITASYFEQPIMQVTRTESFLRDD